MNRKLSDWASIAEIVSGIAVVVTLVILIVGIRENTSVTETSIYFDVIDSINELNRDIWKDPELSWLFGLALSGELEGLDERERVRLRQVTINELRNGEKAFFANEYEIIGDREWQRIVDGICGVYSRARMIEIDVARLPILAQDYRDFMAATCSDDGV